MLEELPARLYQLALVTLAQLHITSIFPVVTEPVTILREDFLYFPTWDIATQERPL